eukprot:COSAG02_NODE_34190_length_488_cov_0.879177_1_plen_53_part_10
MKSTNKPKAKPSHRSKQTTKSNAVEVVDESKDEDAADAKKKAKNKKQAERRKA